LSSLSGKIVVVQCSPPEPQTSYIGVIAGGISAVIVTKHQYNLSEALVESIVLLQSYLIKMTRITTNTIATMTALIPPAIGPL
jgi:hypothetical protein